LFGLQPQQQQQQSLQGFGQQQPHDLSLRAPALSTLSAASTASNSTASSGLPVMGSSYQTGLSQHAPGPAAGGMGGMELMGAYNPYSLLQQHALSQQQQNLSQAGINGTLGGGGGSGPSFAAVAAGAGGGVGRGGGGGGGGPGMPPGGGAGLPGGVRSPSGAMPEAVRSPPALTLGDILAGRLS
jgi:hypothetical protein